MSEIKKVRLVISQPKVRKAPSEWDCTAVELERSTNRTMDRAFHCWQVVKIEKPGAYIHHLRPGEKQCAYCKAAVDCPKYAELVAQAVFNTDDMPEVDPTSEVQPSTHVPVYPELLAARYLAIPLIRKWCDKIEGKVLEGIEDGTLGAKQGLKPIAGREGNREWSDAEAAELLLKSFKLKQEDMYTFNLISPTKAIEKLKESPRRLKKVEELIKRKPGSMTVVHVSDKRPALAIGAYAASDMPEVVETPPPAAAQVEQDAGDDLI